MRIVIAGPPKTGNVWLKCLLATAYGLRSLGPAKVPARPELPLFRAWVERGGFADDAVFHQHYDYSAELADAIEAVPARIVTIIRDPYDTFVSSYFTLQKYVAGNDGQGGGSAQVVGEREGRRRAALKGKSLDDPEILEHLRGGGFRNNMLKAHGWLASGRGVVVRYEDLHADPAATLGRLAETLGPLPAERIAQAIESCSADTIRQQGGRRSGHVRAATVGDSRNRLSEEQLAVFREQHADLIRALGYEVR